jgi:hypothetical protein
MKNTDDPNYLRFGNEPPQNHPASCGICLWNGTYGELKPILLAELRDQLEPAQPMPAGLCPCEDCGCFAYVEAGF